MSDTQTDQARDGRTAADLDEQSTAHGAEQSTAHGAEQSTDDGAEQAPKPEPSKEEISRIEDVEEAMRDVVDPELGINVVDLGLVYDIRVSDDNVATIDMTLTSAACPLTDVIEDQTASVLVGAEKVVDDYKINWVWMPPWGPQMITDDGREQLRALGFTV